MLEIKISTNTAIMLLTERMESELRFRQRIGIIEQHLTLNDMSYKELIKIVETAAFDLVSLLPADILIKETNISSIVSKAINGLSQHYSMREFILYSKEMAEHLLEPIKTRLKKFDSTSLFLSN